MIRKLCLPAQRAFWGYTFEFYLPLATQMVRVCERVAVIEVSVMTC